MYYDIHNISKDRWKSSVVVHLGGDIARGFESVCIAADGVLENIPKERVTEQMLRLAKKKRQRPPLIEMREIDYDARVAEKEKQLEVVRARGEKKLLKAKEAQSKEESAPEPKKSKSKKKDKELTDHEVKALESGSELPS